MIKKVAFTMYPVKDINRAKNFYLTNFGLKASSEYSHGSEGTWVEYDLPEGGCLALTNMAQGIEPSANAGGSVAFEVSDYDATIDKLKKNGVSFKMETLDTPVCRLSVIIDSEGNAITIHKLRRD